MDSIKRGDEVTVAFKGTALDSTDGSEQIRVMDSFGRTHIVYVSSIGAYRVINVDKPARPSVKVGDIWRHSVRGHVFDYVALDRGNGIRLTCINERGSRSVTSPFTEAQFFSAHSEARKVSSLS